MIFTREQWFEVWKQHMGPFAESFSGDDLDPDRTLGPPEYDSSYTEYDGFPKQLNDIILAIAAKDAAEIGIHPDWIEFWTTGQERHLSLVWVILWIDHPNREAGGVWRQPR